MVSAPTREKPKTREEYNKLLMAAMLAGDWVEFARITSEGIAQYTNGFNDDSSDYWDAVDDSADTMVTNAQTYAQKKNELKDDLKKAAYLALVAEAELQLAIAATVKRVGTGQIERITHPEMGEVCVRCKDLEGTHDADEPDLYWSHPNCHCEWSPVETTGFSSGSKPDESSSNYTDNLTYESSNPIIIEGKTMTTAQFGKYSKAEREEMVRKGWALPDKESGGAFPVKNREDLRDALHRIGTTNHPRSQVVAFLRKRAKELDAEDMLGDKTAPASHGVTLQLKDTAQFSERKLTPDGMVIRRGKVFEAGSRFDMHGIPFVTTQEDLNQMVLNFKPIPVGSGHPEAPSPLDGHLGTVTNLYLGENPNDLYGEVAIPPFVDEILQKKNEGRVSMIFNRHTKEPLGLDFVSEPNVVDAALMASFARTRHDTPEGQRFMQDMHDATAKRGAICKQDKSAHASRHEVSATQQIHDISAQHGAKCPGGAKLASSQRGRKMSWDWKSLFSGLFEAVNEQDAKTAKMAGDDPEHDFEANWQEEQAAGLGTVVNEQPDDFESNWNEDEDGDADGDYGPAKDEDEEQGGDFHPAALTDANPQPEGDSKMSKPAETEEITEVTDANDVKFATVMARNVQLEAELARERAVRIEAEAVSFADGEINNNRSLPAEREMLIELYRQASADDSQLGEVKLAGGHATSRCERLRTLFSSRDEHWMTKEMLSTTLSPKVIAAATETARMSIDAINKPMDAKRKRELLNHTPLGQKVPEKN